VTLRNLLLVSYHFPPFGGSGVQRAAKLARYLPDGGWRPFVLTAGHRHYPLHDPSLLDELPRDVVVAPVRGFEPGSMAAALTDQLRVHRHTSRAVDALEDRLCWRLLAAVSALHLPETELLWVPAAIWRARRLIRQHRIEAVITTSPPSAAHLVGLHVKRRLRVPWIADLRDPITDNFSYKRTGSLADRFIHWLERASLHHADQVVVTCPEFAERLRDRYPTLGADSIATITNGFDPLDAPGRLSCFGNTAGPDQNELSPDAAGARFVLAHVGAFYREQSIVPLLEAVRALRATRADIAQRLTVRIVGSIAASQRSAIRPDDGVFLEYAGYRQHREAIRDMAQAQALLLTTPPNDGGRLCIPAKTFEYLAFGRHIISVVHPGTALVRILEKAGNATIVRHGDRAGLVRAIESRIDAWLAGGREPARDLGALEEFRRDYLAERYARLVETCVDGPRSLRLAGDVQLAEEAA
jgi:glycosyltransferase involved in cell wall biosynthesis